MGKEAVLLGDSITQGLGSKKINFTENLNSLLGDGFHVDNMALTGTTISYAQKIGQKIDNNLRIFFSWLIYRLDGSEQWVRVETLKKYIKMLWNN